MLTETWLNDSILDNEILGNDYNIFRYDRNLKTSNKKTGGGVLIAINSSLISSKVDLPYIEIEMLCVCVTLKLKRLFLLCVYIPPSSNDCFYKCCSNKLEFRL